MVHSTRRFVLSLAFCYFVLVFFSPFSIAITSLGEKIANLSAFRTFVRFVLACFCLFPLPLGVWEGLFFPIVAHPGLSLTFYALWQIIIWKLVQIFRQSFKWVVDKTMFVIWSWIRIQSNICASKNKPIPPPSSLSTDHFSVAVLLCSCFRGCTCCVNFVIVFSSTLRFSVAWVDCLMLWKWINLFHPCRPIQIPLQTVQIHNEPSHQDQYCMPCSYWVLTQTHICNNGCVQINRWKSPFRKLGDERVKDTVHQNDPNHVYTSCFSLFHITNIIMWYTISKGGF